MLVWVTGVPGTGKSTLCEALRSRGRVAVDADLDDFSYWVGRDDGERPTDVPCPLPASWYDIYAWRIDRGRVAGLATESGGAVAYLCGTAENETEIWDLFDRVVCLVIDDETVRRRLASRTTNPFGKHDAELAAVLRYNRGAEARYRHFGATIVDGTQPIEAIVGELLALV